MTNKIVLGTFFLTQALVWFLVTTIVPYPYMDEIFHIKQYLSFNRWIRGEVFSWDPSITTFPGLYLFSLIPAIPLTYELDTPSGHVVSILRGVNAFIIFPAIFFVLYRLSNKSTLTALIICVIPFNWFYSHLYYTDNLSTLFVLLIYMFQKEGNLTRAGLAGLCAVLSRQTNIVWVFGFSCLSLWEDLRAPTGLIGGLKKLWIQIFLGISFLLFLRYNDWSLVIGHHEHHSLSHHFAQINYAILTTLAVSWPLIIQKLSIRKLVSKKFLVVLLLSIACAEFGTVVHPFILSDHRHYSFYLYKRILSFRSVRSFLIPILIAIVTTSTGTLNPLSLVSTKNLARVVFLFCTIVTLVPSPLIEFRYFNIPMTLAVIEMVRLGSKSQRIVTLLFCVAVNVVTMYVFLYRPFESADWGTSRFMY
jgi:alpha-1,2-glucosyltransferase